jgi:hypothetical protein
MINTGHIQRDEEAKGQQRLYIYTAKNNHPKCASPNSVYTALFIYYNYVKVRKSAKMFRRLL